MAKYSISQLIQGHHLYMKSYILSPVTTITMLHKAYI